MKHTLQEIQNTTIEDVGCGREIADYIFNWQIDIMDELKKDISSSKQEKLIDLHYNLRKERKRIQKETGKLAIKKKKSLQ